MIKYDAPWVKETPSYSPYQPDQHERHERKSKSARRHSKHVKSSSAQAVSALGMQAPTAEPCKKNRLTKSDFTRLRRYEGHKMRVRACMKYVNTTAMLGWMLFPVFLMNLLSTPGSLNKYEAALRPEVLKLADVLTNCLHHLT